MLEVNFGLTLLSENSIKYVINNITPGILKLGLYQIKVTDAHIETLVTRCKKLTSLDLRESDISDKSLTSIIKHTKLEELNICDCSISFTKILELKLMPRLKALVFLVSENNMTGFRYICPKIIQKNYIFRFLFLFLFTYCLDHFRKFLGKKRNNHHA